MRTWFIAMALFWQVAGTHGFAAEAGKFENFGFQITARTIQAAAFTQDKDGRVLVCFIVRNHPSAKLLVADVETGAVKLEMELPDASGGWGATTASDNSVYLGTEPKGKLFRWVPGETNVRDLGAAIAGETFLWNLAPGPNSEVFGGTYGGARIYRYSPGDGFCEPVPGPIGEDATYSRSIAYDAVGKRLWVGLGVKAPSLIEVNLETKEKREWLSGKFPGEQAVYGLSLSGNYLFAKLQPSNRTLVFDVRTRAVVGEVEISGLYETASQPSPRDGLIYYVGGGGLKVFDPANPRSPAKRLAAVSGSQAMKWLHHAGDGGESVLVILTPSGQLVKYHQPTGKVERVELRSAEQPCVLESLALGADGRIWMGSYLSGGAAAFDPKTGKTEQFKGIAQAEDIEAFEDKLYFGIYPRGRVYEFDVTKAWDTTAGNPRQIAEFPNQSRPVTLLGVPSIQRLYVGMIPEYGILGGDLAVLDTATQKWATFAGVVRSQSVVSLAYADGLVVGGTTVWGGLGIDPTEKEGRLFLWDPVTNQKIFETVPVPGKGIVSGLTTMPDGTVWGFSQGTLFVFDVKKRTVVEMRNFFPVDFVGRAMWQEASMIVHPNGKVYALADNRLLCINRETKEFSVLQEIGNRKHTRPFALDRAGRVYFTQGIELWRYTP